MSVSISGDIVLEVTFGIGLVCLWLSFLMLALHLSGSDLSMNGFDIPPLAKGLFITGDVIVVVTGLILLFQSHFSGATESVRLRWGFLYLGFIFSVQLPAIIRSLVFHSGEFFKAGGADDSSKHLIAILATAFATAVSLVVTITAAMAVDMTPRLRYNDRIKTLSRWSIILGIACGEMFFIAGIIEYEYSRTMHSSVVLLVLSLLLVTAGYIPARFFSNCQHYFDEEVPLMR